MHGRAEDRFHCREVRNAAWERQSTFATSLKLAWYRGRWGAIAFIAFKGYVGRMADVLEVRPGEVAPRDLAAFERVLEPLRRGAAARLVGPDGDAMELPEGIHELLVSIVENLKAGNGVTVIPMHAELTTVEAAELLNVSRPYLIKQLQAGELPYHMVGTHRRLRLADVLAYRDRMDQEAEAALAAMTAEAEELGLYGE